MFYRLHQFWLALFPHLQPEELTWLDSTLDQAALSLFYSQPIADQRHALDVAKSLAAHKSSLNRDEYNLLLTAALLHDCGKSMANIHLWHRVFVVLMQNLPASVWVFLAKTPTPLASPLQMFSCHPAWGAELAAKAGLGPEICTLIQEHHCPSSRLGSLLFEADNAN